MNSKIWIGIVVAIVILGGGAFVLSNMGGQDNKMMSKEDTMAPSDKMAAENDKMAMEKDAMIMEKDKMTMSDTSGEEKDTMMKKDAPTPTPTEKEAMMMTKEGMYKDYSAQTVTNEQKAGQKVVLFFHASWCPTCKAADTAFKANTGKIPAGVTVLKTDYDSNKELKTKYGITNQHTFVQIDNNGNMVTKWVSGDIDMLVKNIK